MAVMPRWPGWSHLPRDARDVLFLLGVIALTLVPHFSHLPPWCPLLTVLVMLWRARLAVANAALPGRWALTAVLVLAMGLTLWSHRTLVGKDAGITMLVVLMVLKTLELRARHTFASALTAEPGETTISINLSKMRWFERWCDGQKAGAMNTRSLRLLLACCRWPGQLCAVA